MTRMMEDVKTSAVPQPKCAYCGSLPHHGVCPTVKAIEYFQDGTVKRVEFKTANDFPPLKGHWPGDQSAAVLAPVTPAIGG